MKLNYPLVIAAIAILSVSCMEKAVETPTKNNTPQTQPVTSSSPTPDTSNSTVIKSGKFIAGEHPTQGKASLVQERNKNYIELDRDFQTNQGPDLFVILHRSSDVLKTTQPPAYPIKENDYVSVAALEKTSGVQRYAIPDRINLSDYNSVAIWCRQFNATFGYAPLVRTN